MKLTLYTGQTQLNREKNIILDLNSQLSIWQIMKLKKKDFGQYLLKRFCVYISEGEIKDVLNTSSALDS